METKPKSVYRKVTEITRFLDENKNKQQRLKLSCGCERVVSHIKKEITLQTIPQIACINPECPQNK